MCVRHEWWCSPPVKPALVNFVREKKSSASARHSSWQAQNWWSFPSSLWSIPDQQTVLLIEQYFTNLAAGMKKSTALRPPQLTRIKARHERNASLPPLLGCIYTDGEGLKLEICECEFEL
ncbi:CHAT domain-containing protein [Gimesia maris]|nr:CHAT domain-containing protein [Gimesia maris]